MNVDEFAVVPVRAASSTDWFGGCRDSAREWVPPSPWGVVFLLPFRSAVLVLRGRPIVMCSPLFGHRPARRWFEGSEDRVPLPLGCCFEAEERTAEQARVRVT